MTTPVFLSRDGSPANFAAKAASALAAIILTPSVLIILAIGGTIAAIAPFDLAFDAATRGVSVLRICAFWLLTITGACFAERAGFPLYVRGAKLIGWAAAIGVAAAVALIDGFIFRASLDPSYVQIFSSISLGGRYVYFMLRAFNENVFYRLFLFSILACLFGRVWRNASGRPAPVVILIAAVISQTVNIGINVVILSHDPLSPALLTYDAIRYVAPGVLWAYLFSRFSFATAEIASVGCHIFLQPLLGLLLA